MASPSLAKDRDSSDAVMVDRVDRRDDDEQNATTSASKFDLGAKLQPDYEYRCENAIFKCSERLRDTGLI